MNTLKQEGKDIYSILNAFSDEEKKQAYAMLQGMLLGRELAQQEAKSA